MRRILPVGQVPLMGKLGGVPMTLNDSVHALRITSCVGQSGWAM